MKIPPEINLVRFTGFGAGAFVPTPKGFERADRLPGDHQAYAVRRGYRLERCSGAHGFDRGCPLCLPFHGAIAVPLEPVASARGRVGWRRHDTGFKHDIDAEIRAGVAAYPDFTKRPPEIVIGSYWTAEVWGLNLVLDMRVSWCGDTEVKLSRGGWWEAKAMRRTFDIVSIPVENGTVRSPRSFDRPETTP